MYLESTVSTVPIFPITTWKWRLSPKRTIISSSCDSSVDGSNDSHHHRELTTVEAMKLFTKIPFPEPRLALHVNDRNLSRRDSGVASENDNVVSQCLIIYVNTCTSTQCCMNKAIISIACLHVTFCILLFTTIVSLLL